VPQAQPRPGADLAAEREAVRADALDADHLTVDEYGQPEVPVFNGHSRELTPVELQRVDRQLLAGCVGPGELERHHGRVVDAVEGDVDDVVDQSLGRDSQLEAGRTDAQIEKGPMT